MILPKIAENAIGSAVSVYIHFKMKRPDWAPLVTSLDEVAQSLKADSEGHLILDPVFYLIRKMDPNMSDRLFRNAAEELVGDKPEWFPKIQVQSINTKQER